MSKYSHLFTDEGKPRVTHRWLTDIPNCTPAYDIFVCDKDGYLTIKNPAPKYQGNAYVT